MKKPPRPITKIAKFVLILLIAIFVTYKFILIDVPDLHSFAANNPTFTSYMNDDDKLNATVHADGIHFVALGEIASAAIRAVLAAEDDTFFEHHGFNWQQIQLALKKNLKKKKFSRGASTITQQLARNLFLSRNKTVWRKLREIFITWQLEHNLTKQRILELYLNTAEFGPGIYGISDGTQYHFKTAPKNLTSSQAALLAALLPRPKLLGKKPYPSYTFQRQQKIQNLMGNIAWPVTATESNLPTTSSNTIKPPQPTHANLSDPSENKEKNDLTELDQSLPEEVFVDE